MKKILKSKKELKAELKYSLLWFDTNRNKLSIVFLVGMIYEINKPIFTYF